MLQYLRIDGCFSDSRRQVPETDKLLKCPEVQATGVLPQSFGGQETCQIL